MKIHAHLFKNPLVLFQIAGWTGYAITDHVGHLLYGEGHIASSLASGFLAMTLTSLIVVIINKLKYYHLALQGFVMVSLLFVTSVIWLRLFSIFHGHKTIEEVLQYTLPQWLSGASDTFFLFVGWAGLYAGSKYFLVNRQQQLELQQALVIAKQAQLQTLRYQLNPHFLFNVLNSIDVSLMADKKDTCHAMLKHLSQFLRNSLQNGDKEKIPLKQELSVLQEFISIEQVRFIDRLTVKLNIQPECQSALLPPMLLQPLMENAIKFAWSQTQHGTVELAANKQGQQLAIEMINSKVNAPDMRQQAQAETTLPEGTGTGLKNTRERLQVTYGDDATLTTEESDNQYTIRLSLPWINKF